MRALLRGVGSYSSICGIKPYNCSKNGCMRACEYRKGVVAESCQEWKREGRTGLCSSENKAWIQPPISEGLGVAHEPFAPPTTALRHERSEPASSLLTTTAKRTMHAVRKVSRQHTKHIVHTQSYEYCTRKRNQLQVKIALAQAKLLSRAAAPNNVKFHSSPSVQP